MRHSSQSSNLNSSSYHHRVRNLLLFLQTNDSTPRLDTVLRSLNLSMSFQTSIDSINYIRTEEVPSTVPPVAEAAVFPTESGFDITFGVWFPYNLSGKWEAPVKDKKWQYEIATQQWTDQEIILKNWFHTDTSTRVFSSMTAWIPSLRKGFLFGGAFASTNGTSGVTTYFEEHNGLITYDQATNTWTNETTPFGGINFGGLVNITTATDEVLIQFGGRSEWATRLVCPCAYWISPPKMLIVPGRETFPRSTSTAQTGQNGIPKIYRLVLRCLILDSHSALLSNRLRMVQAIKSTLWEALKLAQRAIGMV